jgi:hypothetical protein
MPKSHWFWTNTSLKGETDGADRDHGPIYNHWVDVSSWICRNFAEGVIGKVRRAPPQAERFAMQYRDVLAGVTPVVNHPSQSFEL